MITAILNGEIGVRSAGTSVIARNEAMTFVTDFKVNGKQSVKAKKMLTA